MGRSIGCYEHWQNLVSSNLALGVKSTKEVDQLQKDS